jgi:hypothetical protein
MRYPEGRPALLVKYEEHFDLARHYENQMVTASSDEEREYFWSCSEGHERICRDIEKQLELDEAS